MGAAEALFEIVGAPAGNAGDREERGEHIDWDAVYGVDKGGGEFDIGVNCPPLASLQPLPIPTPLELQSYLSR